MTFNLKKILNFKPFRFDYRRDLILLAMSLSPFKRRLFLIIIDIFILLFTIFATLWLQNFDSTLESYIVILKKFIPIIFFAIVLYIFTGQYKSLSKYAGTKSFYLLALRNIFVIIFGFFISLNSLSNFIPIQTLILYAVLINFFSAGVRLFLRDNILRTNKNKTITPIAIYGQVNLGSIGICIEIIWIFLFIIFLMIIMNYGEDQ